MLRHGEPDGALDLLSVDAAGTVNDANWVMNYNRVNQVTSRSVTAPSYVWGGLSKSLAYQVNGLNQYTSIGGQVAANDNNSLPRTRRSAPRSGGNLSSYAGWTYTYDAENRLVSAVNGGSGVNATYSYDAYGRRIAKTVGGTTTRYYYDADKLLLEYNGAGTLLRGYAFGPGVDDPAVVWNFTGVGLAKWVLLKDPQGSIIGEASPTDGSLANAYSYSPYGEPDRTTGSLFRYTGQVLDAETGLHYYKARMYHAGLGRFLQTDPVGYKDDLDLYTYVANDPVNYNDPTGNGKVGFVVELIEGGVKRIGSMLSKEEMVSARQAEKNVQVVSDPIRQQAGAIERAAAGDKSRVMRHDGHDLKSGGKGLSHFQTEGKKGHTFYSLDLASLGAAATAIIKFIDYADPTTIESVGCQTLDCRPMSLGQSLSAGNLSAVSNMQTGSLQSVLNNTAAAKGYDSVKLNSNGSVTGSYKPIGSLITRNVTCDSKGVCK